MKQRAHRQWWWTGCWHKKCPSISMLNKQYTASWIPHWSHLLCHTIAIVIVAPDCYVTMTSLLYLLPHMCHFCHVAQHTQVCLQTVILKNINHAQIAVVSPLLCGIHQYTQFYMYRNCIQRTSYSSLPKNSCFIIVLLLVSRVISIRTACPFLCGNFTKLNNADGQHIYIYTD